MIHKFNYLRHKSRKANIKLNKFARRKKRNYNYIDYMQSPTGPIERKDLKNARRVDNIVLTTPAVFWAALAFMNKRWHTFISGERSSPYPRTTSTGTGMGYYVAPEYDSRDFESIDYDGPIITEQHLPPIVLDELRKQVKYAKSLGYDFWSDYGCTKEDGTVVQSMQKGLYGREQLGDKLSVSNLRLKNLLNRVQQAKQFVSDDVVDMITTTFGHYNFKTDEYGNTIVEDVYDFDPSQGLGNAFFADLFGSTKEEKKNIRWKINLGKI